MFFHIYFELFVVKDDIIIREELIALERVFYKHILEKESWEVARYIYCRLKNISGDSEGIIILKQEYFVNFLLCEKMLNKDIKDKVSVLKFQLQKEKFEIFRDALLDDYKKLYDDYCSMQSKKLQNEDTLSIEDIKSLKIFKNFKQTEYYSVLINWNL